MNLVFIASNPPALHFQLLDVLVCIFLKRQKRPKFAKIQKMMNELAKDIYEANKEKGFWDKERNVGEMLMLVTSELGEAMEAHRKNRVADWGRFDYKNVAFTECIKDTFEDELADAIIRLLDMCGGLGIDIQRHITEKLKYNATRERLHGKLY